MKEETLSKQVGIKSKLPTVIFWISTVIVCWELGFGALWDYNLLMVGYVPGILKHLGYPLYLAFILGTWKVLGCIVILFPRWRRMKEWAYAGAVFNFSGAIFSILLSGDKPINAIWPLLFCVFALLSWWYRPQSRKL